MLEVGSRLFIFLKESHLCLSAYVRGGKVNYIVFVLKDVLRVMGENKHKDHKRSFKAYI